MTGWLRWGLALVGTMCAASAPAQAPPAAPPQMDTEWHNRQMLYLIVEAAGEGWRRTPEGVRYRRVKGDGTGPRPAPTDTVTIHYAGRFIDGVEFDSSIARGEPAKFPLPRLIKGWQQAVPLMGVGDTYEFAIPQQLAYGTKGKGLIPGGATLLFTIELIGIEGR